MSDDHSDGEGGSGHEVDPVDTIEDMEIKLNLPREVDGEQDRPREDIRESPGAMARRSDIDLNPQTGPYLNGPTRTAPPEYCGTS